MLRNYITIALRIFKRNKIYVAINLVSLGFALACCILAYLNYDYRARFDENHTHTQNIYRLNSLRNVDGQTQPWALSPLPLAEILVNNFSGAERFARLYSNGAVVKHNEHVFSEKIHYVDKSVFDFFDLPFKSGGLAGFSDNRSLILNEDMAAKYFGTQQPVGKEIVIVTPEGKEEVFTVTAVLEKAPLNSSFQFDIVISFDHLLNSKYFTANSWNNPNLLTTFVEIKAKQNIKSLEKGLQPYVTLHNQARNDWKVDGFYFQPFKEIATSSDIDFDGFVHGSPLQSNPRGVLVIVPAIMSLFILLITCFNFTNISIAFAGNRLKEIGMRKVLGVRRIELIKQFLTENIVLCLIASILALIIVSSLLSAFNGLTGGELKLNFKNNLVLWLLLVLLPLITAIIAGLYPAVYISSFQPIGILKGKTKLGSSSRFTRFLLTAQFSLSCLALIVGIILTQNAYYQQEVDYGYDIDQVAVVELNAPQSFTPLSNAMRQHPKIKGIAGTAQQVGDGSYQVTVQADAREFKAQVAHVGGKEYLSTMGITLTQGRHFNRGKADEEESILVNQTLMKALDLSEPLGKRLKVDSTYFTIVGVVEDYKEYGLHGLVPPCILRLADLNNFNYLVVRAAKQDLPEVYKDLQTTWLKVVPNVPYKGFLQTELTEKERYLNTGFSSVAFFMAVVTMLLSGSGLFALVSLNVLRRSKEIGVRKIVGASVSQIIILINKDFIRIVFIAFTVGSLLGYLLVSKLIFKFIYVYHPPIGAGAFLATLSLILISCAFTVGFKVYQAAITSPIKALRTE